MKARNFVITLVLAVVILMAAPGYSGHPWEELNNNDGGPHGCRAFILQDDAKVILIPIFSDFLIVVSVKGVHEDGEHRRDSGKRDNGSYQIIFPW